MEARTDASGIVCFFGNSPSCVHDGGSEIHRRAFGFLGATPNVVVSALLDSASPVDSLFPGLVGACAERSPVVGLRHQLGVVRYLKKATDRLRMRCKILLL
jgi:hypothetical protein